MTTREEVEQRIRNEWREKLQAAVLRAQAREGGQCSLAGPHGPHVALLLNGWDVHELYTVLVDPSGEPEGCCGGCTRLPDGWCRTCDEQRHAERSNVRPVVEWEGPRAVGGACEYCGGNGLVQVPPQDTSKVTRSLWKWALCSCIWEELAWLRGYRNMHRERAELAEELARAHFGSRLDAERDR